MMPPPKKSRNIPKARARPEITVAARSAMATPKINPIVAGGSTKNQLSQPKKGRNPKSNPNRAKQPRIIEIIFIQRVWHMCTKSSLVMLF